MKNLVLGAALLAGLLQVGTGCIISSDDDDDIGDGDDLGDGGGEGVLYRANFTCPPDADTVIITATPTSSGSSHDPEEFDCAAGFGEILFDAGSYDIDVDPTGPVDFLELSTTFSGNDGDLVEDDFDFPQDLGYFFLTWTIDGEEPSLGCADFKSAGFSVVSTLIGPNTATDDIFDCDAGEGVTSELELGEYEVQVTILDENEEVLAASESFPAAIDFGDQLEDLGNLDVVTQ